MTTWKRTRPVMQNLQDVSRHTIYTNRSLIACMGVLGGLCLLVPVAYNKLPKAISGAMLAVATINFAGMAGLSRAAIEGEKIWASNTAAQRFAFKVARENELNLELTRQNLYTKEELLGILRSIPEDWRDYFASEYELIPLLPVPKPVPVATLPSPAPISTAITNRASYMEVLVNPSQEEDTTWVTQEFLDSNIIVFGKRGSGKSTFLRAVVVAFLSAHPDGLLIICDLHFDVDDEKKSSWLPGMSMTEQLKRFVADTPAKVLDAFRRFGKQMRDRVDKKDKTCPPIKFICDEFNGVLSRFSEDEREEILGIIQFFTYECRKFNQSRLGADIGMTLGIHNLKKGGCGIDSTVMTNMNILVLGNMLNDPNLSKSLPLNFECKELEKTRSALQRELPNGYWACVAYIEPDDPSVQVLPDLEAFTRSFELIPDSPEIGQAVTQIQANEDPWNDDPSDPMKLLKIWYKNQEVEPTDADLSQEYKRVTGVEEGETLNQKGLQYLRELLRKS